MCSFHKISMKKVLFAVLFDSFVGEKLHSTDCYILVQIVLRRCVASLFQCVEMCKILYKNSCIAIFLNTRYANASFVKITLNFKVKYFILCKKIIIFRAKIVQMLMQFDNGLCLYTKILDFFVHCYHVYNFGKIVSVCQCACVRQCEKKHQDDVCVQNRIERTGEIYSSSKHSCGCVVCQCTRLWVVRVSLLYLFNYYMHTQLLAIHSYILLHIVVGKIVTNKNTILVVQKYYENN